MATTDGPRHPVMSSGNWRRIFPTWPAAATASIPESAGGNNGHSRSGRRPRLRALPTRPVVLAAGVTDGAGCAGGWPRPGRRQAGLRHLPVVGCVHGRAAGMACPHPQGHAPGRQGRSWRDYWPGRQCKAGRNQAARPSPRAQRRAASRQRRPAFSHLTTPGPCPPTLPPRPAPPGPKQSGARHATRAPCPASDSRDDSFVISRPDWRPHPWRTSPPAGSRPQPNSHNPGRKPARGSRRNASPGSCGRRRGRTS